jgi:hypothetical protein
VDAGSASSKSVFGAFQPWRVLALLLTAIGVFAVHSSGTDDHRSSSVSTPKAASQGETSSASSCATSSRPSFGGKWYFWSDARPAHLGYGKASIWFVGYDFSMLWRYDVASRTFQTVTPLDGLPLDRMGVRDIVVANDGTCIVGDSFIWRPAMGWKRLPGGDYGGDKDARVGGADFAFDVDSRLFALVTARADGKLRCWISRLEGEEWVKVRDVPICRSFIPLRNGFFLAVQEKEGKCKPEFAPMNEGPTVKYEFPKKVSFLSWRSAGDKVFGVFLSDNHVRWYEIGSDKLTEMDPKLWYVGFDLMGKTLFTRTKDQITATQSGETFPAPPVDTDYGSTVLRDANGQVWFRNLRLEGKEWRTCLPSIHLRNPLAVMEPGRYQLDETSKTWKSVREDLPDDCQAFDPAAGTAWIDARMDDKYVWQLLQLDGNSPRVLRTVSQPADYDGQVRFKDASGGWWCAGRDVTGDSGCPVLIDEKGNTRRFTVKEGDTWEGPTLFRSPRGNVWLWDTGGFHRFDAKDQKFVADEPYEECSFTFGDLHLARVGGAMWGNQACQSLYVEQQSKWVRFRCPHYPDLDCYVSARPVRGNRLLVTVGVRGVAEYDVSTGRWALLHTNSDYAGWFDARGRRLLVGDGGVFMYEGDALRPLPARNISDADFDALIVHLSDTEWKVREDAEKQLRGICEANPKRVVGALARKELSTEAKSRLTAVVEEHNARPLDCVFEAMHPTIGGELYGGQWGE